MIRIQGINLAFARAKTPKPDSNWRIKSEQDRIGLIKKYLSEHSQYSEFMPIEANDDGQVIFSSKLGLPVNQRSSIFLELEKLLKEHINECITVWMEPIGDKSSLRNLRGIKVKS